MIYGKLWFDDHIVACKTVGFICTLSCIVSLLSIVMISINRYVHICQGSRVSNVEICICLMRASQNTQHTNWIMYLL